MFGLTFEKLLLIGVIAVFLIGPQKLPLYAQKLGALVRTARAFADTEKARVAEELGLDFTDTDWKKLDPRQYDPRQIVRRALTDDPSPEQDEPALATPLPPTTSPAGRVAPGGWQQTLLARVGGSHQS